MRSPAAPVWAITLQAAASMASSRFSIDTSP